MTDKSAVVVDDDPVTRFIIVKALKRAGFQTSEFESGSDTIDFLAHHVPSVVLLDIQLLHGQSGYAVCKAIKSQYSCYVVLISASPADPDQFAASGADLFVPKNREMQKKLEALADAIINND
jgi:CheY-like chemotaxis protein